MKTKIFWMQKDKVKDGSKLVSGFYHSILSENPGFEIEDIYGDNYMNLDYVESRFKEGIPNESIVFIQQMWHKIHYDFIKLAKKYNLKVWVICHTHTMYNDIIPLLDTFDSKYIPTDGFNMTPYIYPKMVDKVITLNFHDYNYYSLIGCKNIMLLPQVVIDFEDKWFNLKRESSNEIISIGSINGVKHSYLMLDLMIKYFKLNPKSNLRYRIITQTKDIPENFMNMVNSCDNIILDQDVYGEKKYQHLVNCKALMHFGNVETGPMTYAEANLTNTPVIFIPSSCTDVDVNIPLPIDINDIKGSLFSILESLEYSDFKGNKDIINNEYYLDNYNNISKIKYLLPLEKSVEYCIRGGDSELLADGNYAMYYNQMKLIKAYSPELRELIK